MSFLSKSFFTICLRFSVGLRCWILLGQSFMKVTMQSPSHLVTDLAVRAGVLSVETRRCVQAWKTPAFIHKATAGEKLDSLRFLRSTISLSKPLPEKQSHATSESGWFLVLSTWHESRVSLPRWQYTWTSWLHITVNVASWDHNQSSSVQVMYFLGKATLRAFCSYLKSGFFSVLLLVTQLVHSVNYSMHRQCTKHFMVVFLHYPCWNVKGNLYWTF